MCVVVGLEIKYFDGCHPVVLFIKWLEICGVLAEEVWCFMLCILDLSLPGDAVLP